MIIRNFLRVPQKGRALCSQATTTLLHRIYNILEGLHGEGCTVEKPLDKDGRGWKIVVDDRVSDDEPEVRNPMPFDVVRIGPVWRVYLDEAQVLANNIECERASDTPVTDNGLWSAASYVHTAGELDLNIYLTAWADSTNLNGEGHQFWSLETTATSAHTNVIARVLIASITASGAEQYERGQQVLYSYSHRSTDPIHLTGGGVAEIPIERTPYASFTISDTTAKTDLVCRQNGGIKYALADDVFNYFIRECLSFFFDPGYDPDNDGIPVQYDIDMDEELFRAFADCVWMLTKWPSAQQMPMAANVITRYSTYPIPSGPPPSGITKLVGLDNGLWLDFDWLVELEGYVRRSEFNLFVTNWNTFQTVLHTLLDLNSYGNCWINATEDLLDGSGSGSGIAHDVVSITQLVGLINYECDNGDDLADDADDDLSQASDDLTAIAGDVTDCEDQITYWEGQP